MEQSKNRIAPEASTDERASSSPLQPQQGTAPSAASPDPPESGEPPLVSDCLGDALGEIVAETFPPGHRKPRHDGWTPEAVAGFLRHLAATGVVEHAARAVGRSVTAAHNFRNRSQGRAFAKMWDAILVHRARARLASELQARAVAGCVSVRKRDGIVVGEYHYYDNRLAMALLTRLDRLAEKEAASEAHLRVLSEDLDDYIDCVAAGGDTDAFVESRKPAEPPPPELMTAASADATAGRPDTDPELSLFAALAGCSDYLDVDPRDIEVGDLDLTRKADWSPDQWVRAYRSQFMTWLELGPKEPRWHDSPGAPWQFMFQRNAARAAAEAKAESNESEPEKGAAIDTSDLDVADIWDWTDDQLARAWRSRLLSRLPAEFWDNLAAEQEAGGEGE